MKDQPLRLANITSYSVYVYLKLFSDTDANQRRLVRSKMLNIFNPDLKRILAAAALDTFLGIFGGNSIPLIVKFICHLYNSSVSCLVVGTA